MPYGYRLTKEELLNEAERYERLERESHSQVTSSLSPEYYAQMARKFRERLAAED